MLCKSDGFLKFDDKNIQYDRNNCENDNFYDLVNVSVCAILAEFFLNSRCVLWI